MKLWRIWSLVGLGGVIVGSAVYIGCGGGSGTLCNGCTIDDAGQPPQVPANGLQGKPGSIETFAIKTLYLGEADRQGGAPSNTAWKSYGYNLDNKVTTKTSTDVCTLAAGAPKINQVDGDRGIDNAFGSVILPIVQSAASLPTPSTTISTYIDQGKFTIMLQITGLDDTPTQSAINLGGSLFAAGAYDNGTPTFDSTTDWPVNPQLLNDGATIASGSKVTFNQGYISNGTYVSGDLSKGGITVTLNLVFQGVALSLSVNHAVIWFNHGATVVTNGVVTGITADKTKASYGTIAGVIDTNELISGLKSVAGRISTSLCGAAFDGIAQQIMQASDILVDGTNTAGVPCTGIAIGLGFDAVLVANPTKVSMSDAGTPPDPCTTVDAGGDASGE